MALSRALIILSHDIHQQTIDAMPATLDALLAKGYKFVTVSQLIAMNHPKPPSPPAAVSRTSDKLVKTFWGGDLTKWKEIVRETWVWCFDQSFQEARELVC